METTVNKRSNMNWIRLGPTLAISATIGVACGGGGDDGNAAIQAASLPSNCASLASNPAWGLAGNATILAVTATQIPQQTPLSIGTPPTPNNAIDPASSPDPTKRFPATSTFCQVDVTLSNPGDGTYPAGQKQSIKIRIALPERSEWKDRLMVQGGSGSQGSVDQTGSFGEGSNYEAYLYYAIRLGMVGTTTDAGHTTAQNATFAIDQATHTLNVGQITDWSHRATFYAMRLSKQLAKTYYGRDVKYSYYQGGSGGGYQGMGQLQNHASEYNGFLIGSPAMYWTPLQMATPWPGLAIRDLLTIKGKTLSAAQLAAARTSAIASCDGADGLVDGLVTDPRTCKFSATANICGVAGAPAVPNCLDADQAATVNAIWDGPRNQKGERAWFGWDRTEPIAGLQTAFANNGFFSSIFRWAMKDNTFDQSKVYLNAATKAAAGNPAGSVTFEDILTTGTNTLSDLTDNNNANLAPAKAAGVKVIHTVGNYDKSIFWRQSVRYYRQFAQQQGGGTADFQGLQSWYRFFIMPGEGDGAFHTISPDATGPGVLDPFLALMAWVEDGKAPDKLIAGQSNGPVRTRPLCPYPQWAQYVSGDVNSANSFVCAGSLETPSTIAEDTLATYKHENGN